ncbi:MAG TPA: hypothetical protein VK399_17800 [Longimicrobiaceae bacterium]|jgi:hypothetical protein|nr:hypothetical protein [Longimicrobiaceae bacterium]
MRINFEANDALVELIEQLQQRTGGTKKAVIVGALQMLKWSLDQQDQGCTIAAIRSGDNPEAVREYHSQLMLQSLGS